MVEDTSVLSTETHRVSVTCVLFKSRDRKLNGNPNSTYTPGGSSRKVDSSETDVMYFHRRHHCP